MGSAPTPADAVSLAAIAAEVTLFLAGDVMTGRGIDQALPNPSDPRLCETYVDLAGSHVELAEQANGSFPGRFDGRFLCGDALGVLDRMRPDARIVNLETAVTRCDDAWPRKAVRRSARRPPSVVNRR